MSQPVGGLALGGQPSGGQLSGGATQPIGGQGPIAGSGGTTQPIGGAPQGVSQLGSSDGRSDGSRRTDGRHK